MESRRKGKLCLSVRYLSVTLYIVEEVRLLFTVYCILSTCVYKVNVYIG